jgi:hypothetical protein
MAILELKFTNGPLIESFDLDGTDLANVGI